MHTHSHALFHSCPACPRVWPSCTHQQSYCVLERNCVQSAVPSAPNCCCHRLFCIFPLAPITLLYRYLRMNAVACCTVLPVLRYADTARSLCPLRFPSPSQLPLLYLLSAPPPRPADLLPRTLSQSRSQQFRTFNQRKCLWRNKSSRRSSQSTLLAHNTMLWQQQQTLK